MPPVFSAIPGAQGYQQSNPSALAIASLLGSLQIIKDVGMMSTLRERSIRVTGYLETRLVQSKFYIPLAEVASRYASGSASSSEPGFTIITPSDPECRGAQLSLLILPSGSGMMQRVSANLQSHGVIGDKRDPDVIRLAPTALYNSLEDCNRAATYLDQVLQFLQPA
jgi:kynureninase